VSAFEEGDELLNMAPETMPRPSSNADIEVIAFPHTPPVAFHVPKEEQLVHDGRRAGLVRVELEFDFLGHDGGRGVGATTKVPRDRAEMARGPDD
jgi:hypothetical protein